MTEGRYSGVGDGVRGVLFRARTRVRVSGSVRRNLV